jgi:hypothetical protein
VVVFWHVLRGNANGNGHVWIGLSARQVRKRGQQTDAPRHSREPHHPKWVIAPADISSGAAAIEGEPMPEYLAPGVYVEEVSFRSNVIEGVGTTTTGLVGPTRYRPLYDPLDVLTSLSDYELVYGDGQPLEFLDIGLVDNCMWQAVRAFFTEGGRRRGALVPHRAGARGRAPRILGAGAARGPGRGAADVRRARGPARVAGAAGALPHGGRDRARASGLAVADIARKRRLP